MSTCRVWPLFKVNIGNECVVYIFNRHILQYLPAQNLHRTQPRSDSRSSCWLKPAPGPSTPRPCIINCPLILWSTWLIQNHNENQGLFGCGNYQNLLEFKRFSIRALEHFLMDFSSEILLEK